MVSSCVLLSSRKRREMTLGDDALQLVDQAPADVPGLQRLGQAAHTGRVDTVGENLWQLIHEGGQIGRISPVPSTFELAGHDVVAPLYEPSQVRQLGLHRLAVEAKAPNLCDRPARDIAQIPLAQNAVELFIH